MRPFVRFLHIESASGVILLLCTVAALILANSPWAEAYHDFWHTHLYLGWGEWQLDMSLAHWINDALMTIFFFVVGLEIKRELVDGELREWQKASLPVAAALGGMVAPALIYYSLRAGQEGESGWGIPMATDIAFVVGFLALLGRRVPLGLKIMLLALAIVDDIGAVLVIAVFYSSDISLTALILAVVGFGVTVFFNRIGVRRVTVYVIVGALIWLAVLRSGVHPTVAGVLLGLLTPASAWIGNQGLLEIVAAAYERLKHSPDWPDAPDRTMLLSELGTAARENASPLERLELGLHPWVAFGIMPLFALANAGVTVAPEQITSPVSLAVAAGLVIGKPLGIVFFSWLAVQTGLARLPAGITWRAMVGAGCLAGIGFTMSLFIAGLALEGSLLEAGKLGTLLGSTISAILGMTLLVLFLPSPDRRTEEAPRDEVEPRAEPAALSHGDVR